MLAQWVFISIFVLFGGSFIAMIVYGMVGEHQRKEAYTDVEQRALSDVEPARVDYAYVSGEITETEWFLTAPFSKNECVAYRAEIQRWRRPPAKDHGPKQWIPDFVHSQSSQFLLEDEFSAVAVDGSDAIVDHAYNHEQVSPSGVEPDEQYMEFVNTHDIYTFDDEGVAKAQKVRFAEARIDLTDTVHVAGGVEQASGGVDGATAVINKKLDKDTVRYPFIISDSEIDEAKMEDLVYNQEGHTSRRG